MHDYTLNPLSLFWLVESVQWIFEISTCDVITGEYTIVMSRTLKVTGNYIVNHRSAWFLRVIMSSLRTVVLLAVSEEAKTWLSIYCFVQCIIKQLLDSVFVISRIIKVSVRVISLSLRFRLITPTSTLIILDIKKTSSNNCLVCAAGKVLESCSFEII